MLRSPFTSFPTTTYPSDQKAPIFFSLWLLCLVFAGIDIDGWHFLDVFYTFYTVMTMALFICKVSSEEVRSMFLNFYTSLVAALVYSARKTVVANVILWFIPFTFLVYCLFKRQVAPGLDLRNRTTLAFLGLHLAFAISCFVLANFDGLNKMNGSKRYICHAKFRY